MITQKEIIEIAEQKRLQTKIIDKDWVLGHFLNAMYSFDDVRQNFVFKGGTALKKCYFPDYRFSEDLDFTLLDKNFVINDSFIKEIIKIATLQSGIQFYFQKQKLQKSEDEEQGYEIKIKYWGADHKPNQQPLPPSRWQTAIKLDISFSENIFARPEQKQIFHGYSDRTKISEIILVYSLNEIMGEKLRSLIQRNRPRDIYDIDYLSKHLPQENFPLIKEILYSKAKDKNITISGVSDFVNNKKERSNKRAWQSSLGEHLPVGKLPDFDKVYSDIEHFIEKILNS
jgi:predicted nucleotidyltransferase component of viral defense system